MSAVDLNHRASPWERPSPLNVLEQPEIVSSCDGFDDISDQIRQIRGELQKEQEDFSTTMKFRSRKSFADRSERRKQLMELSCSLRNQQNELNRNNLEDIARQLTSVKDKPPMAPRKELMFSEKDITHKAHRKGHLGRLLGLATKLRFQSAEYLGDKHADDGTAPTECSSVTASSHADCCSQQSHATLDQSSTNENPSSTLNTPPTSEEGRKTVSEICKIFDTTTANAVNRGVPQCSSSNTASEENGSSADKQFSRVDDEDFEDNSYPKTASSTKRDATPSALNIFHAEPSTEMMKHEEALIDNEEKNSTPEECYEELVNDNFHDQVLEALGEILQLQSTAQTTAGVNNYLGAREIQALSPNPSDRSGRRKTKSGLHPKKRHSVVSPSTDGTDTMHLNPIPKRRLRRRELDHSERRRVLSETRQQVTAIIERSEEKTEEHFADERLASSHECDGSSSSIEHVGSTRKVYFDHEQRTSVFLGLSPTFSDSEDET
eukprot:Nitzschia sp. Nitz4//scaffold222_size33694//30244//31821//NITZ4_007867-RA/size33694-snap-gene-0.1-mRNA-1//1//CDS//3329542606//3605//frame0